jgi:nucleoside-diphosphate kinase
MPIWRAVAEAAGAVVAEDAAGVEWAPSWGFSGYSQWQATIQGFADFEPASLIQGEEALQENNMAIERTLSIIKPDAVAKNVIGQIYARFEGAGLKVVAAKMAHLSRGEAEAFYAVHKARPFFKDLVDFMVSGPVMIQVLEGEGAIAKNRELMGATDPKKAEKGTIRADFADSIDANAVHGSDAPETAAVEVSFFFPGMNVYSR